MTLEEVKASDAAFLRPIDIAPLLGGDPQAIRIEAQRTPERLGFPVTVTGTRTMIPHKAFLKYLGENVD